MEKKNYKDKVKEMFIGKRKTENLIILLILFVIVVIAINYIWNGEEQEEKSYENLSNVTNGVKEVSSGDLMKDKTEEKLENILSKIDGVGNVRVMITYKLSSTITPIFDETKKTSNTTESDTSGGTRTIIEEENGKQIVYKENSDGSKEPITKNVESPVIEGAIIVAEGGDNANIKSSIIDAVEAATGLPTHKIQVFKMNE